ncbi:hypothetical protein [uncultured Mucilaginibacter sp.]|uniref:hypothetical protein n=1 Tax=uncultured Mucilaginibacter sp. TaxID=797541 RepID=UPI0025E8C8B6|nr:hypothetical protein [uncultured Mucilaginibacter sp.]
MKSRLLIVVAYCFSVAQPAFGQHFPVVVFKEAPEGVFSFTKKWDYKEDIIKHDDGTFEKIDGEKIEPADTVHQYFTTNCKTNVQGGYTVKYCYAKRMGATIRLNFSGGMPAYANEFNFTLSNNTVNFNPRVVYPELIMDEKIVYKVTLCQLVLYQKNYALATNISGYIKAGFIEIIQNGKKGTKTNKYYLSGYFKTALN